MSRGAAVTALALVCCGATLLGGAAVLPGGGLIAVGRGAVVPRVARPLGALVEREQPPQVLRIDVVLKARASTAPRRSPGTFVSPKEYANRFGAKGTTVALVERTLRDRGLHVLGVSANRLVVRATGSAAVVERALGTKLARYRLPDGREGFASPTAPLLPAAVARHVSAVVGLDSLDALQPAGLARARQRAATRTALQPHAATAGPAPSPACAQQINAAAPRYPGSVLYDTSDLAHAYGFDNLYGAGNLGQGTTVALIEFAPFVTNDIQTFQGCFGTGTAVNVVPVDGGPDTRATTGEQVEAELDIETVIGLAPRTTIDVYEAPNTNSAALDAFAAAIANPAVDVISVSFGMCEPLSDLNFANAEAALFKQAAMEGKTIVASSGDSGSEDCFDETRGTSRTALAVDDPASQPFVTGVGGTTLQAVGPPATEAVWNNSVGAGGGGVSAFQDMPTFQTAAPSSLGVSSTSASCANSSGTCRRVPDVAANAGAPLAIYCTLTGTEGCDTGGWTGLYGTSAGSPTWGAFLALAIASPACGGRSLGFVNPALYVLAAGAGHAGALSDVTQGNNDLGYHGGLYPAGSGYDLATGLGTPIAGTGSGSDGGLATQLCNTARGLASPTTARVSPDAGPLAGGTKVTITGSNLSAVTSVRFGSSPATSFTVVSNTQLTAVAPAGRGNATVSLTTIDGAAHPAKTYQYLATPTVRSLSPRTGKRTGGTRVTVSGTSFVEVAGVRFGSRPARSFRVVSATKLVAVAPAGGGTVAIRVTTPGGTSTASTGTRFSYTK
jgi:subtilase family serine protease